jgi:APA family basic amino acid/polyamine antiporter
MTAHPTAKTGLKRALSLPLITFYGLGTILGAGIYVLVGEVAGAAGMQAPLAFLLAALIAAFTAFSYGELATRIPRSAGEAAYAGAAFSSRLPAALAGYGVIVTGIVSAATILNGFVGYLHEFIPAHRELTIFIALLLMTALAIWGVTESVAAASVITLLEVAGLILVIALCADKESARAFAGRWTEMLPSGNTALLTGMLGGAYIAFFAFVGFEDIVNMAEEVKHPERNLPRAIFISLGIATLLYIIVATLAVLVLSRDQLAASTAPLADMIAAGGRGGTIARPLISLISLVAVINGALIQIIMASRVLYGMASPALAIAPKSFHVVHPARRTPVRATLTVAAVVLAFALVFRTLTLALITSTVTLLVFSLINASLLRLKLRDRSSHAPPPELSCPLVVPILGLVLSLAFILLQFLFS